MPGSMKFTDYFSKKEAKMNSRADQQAEEAVDSASPRCAYFYYVTPGEEKDGHFHGNVAACLMQEADIRPSDNIEDLISDWAQRAKDGQMSPIGWALGDLTWRRESYFVVVLDAPGYRFDSEESLVISNGDHTFKDKRLIPVTTSDGSRMQAIYCRNHIRKRNGEPWRHGDIREEYKPLMLAVTGAKGLVTHEDVGTNLGPPIP
jgi:hypothetical protein